MNLDSRVEIARGRFEGKTGVVKGFTFGRQQDEPDTVHVWLDDSNFGRPFERGDLVVLPSSVIIPVGQPPVLTDDELLTMEIYLKREGNLTPEQTVRLLAWAKFMRPLTEGPAHRRPYHGEF